MIERTAHNSALITTAGDVLLSSFVFLILFGPDAKVRASRGRGRGRGIFSRHKRGALPAILSNDYFLIKHLR